MFLNETIMKKPLIQLCLTVIILLSFNTSNGQTVKTYSGTWSNPEGKITYSYIEDKTTGERIKNGPVSFTSINNQNMNISVKGTYKNNLKEGVWTYNASITSEKDRENNNFYTSGTSICTGTYKKGIPNGAWTVTETTKTRKTHYDENLRKSVWENFSTPIVQVVRAQFSNGIPIKDIYLKKYGDRLSDGYIVTTASFDTTGKLNGKYTITEGNSVTTCTYKCDTLITETIKDIETGKISTYNKVSWGGQTRTWIYRDVNEIMFLLIFLPGDILYSYPYNVMPSHGEYINETVFHWRAGEVSFDINSKDVEVRINE